MYGHWSTVQMLHHLDVAFGLYFPKPSSSLLFLCRSTSSAQAACVQKCVRVSETDRVLPYAETIEEVHSSRAAAQAPPRENITGFAPCCRWCDAHQNYSQGETIRELTHSARVGTHPTARDSSTITCASPSGYAGLQIYEQGSRRLGLCG